jgi:hypothetical protein
VNGAEETFLHRLSLQSSTAHFSRHIRREKRRFDKYVRAQKTRQKTESRNEGQERRHAHRDCASEQRALAVAWFNLHCPCHIYQRRNKVHHIDPRIQRVQYNTMRRERLSEIMMHQQMSADIFDVHSAEGAILVETACGTMAWRTGLVIAIGKDGEPRHEVDAIRGNVHYRLR